MGVTDMIDMGVFSSTVSIVRIVPFDNEANRDVGSMDCTGRLKRRGALSVSASELIMECFEALLATTVMGFRTILGEEWEVGVCFGCFPELLSLDETGAIRAGLEGEESVERCV